MYNYERVADACKGLTVNEIYECYEIVDFIHSVTGIKKSSLIPSDYCYNITNRGADGERFNRWPRLFEYQAYNRYRYLGEGYRYNGDVVYPKTNEKYGSWVDGEFYKTK